jgi:hypothetical protein
MTSEIELPSMPSFSVLSKEHVEGNKWRLTKPFFYFHHTGITVAIPRGFECDGDSVPRIPLIYAMYKGRAIQAAWVHDFLYRQQRGKDFADWMFLEAMKDQGLPARIRYPIYWGPLFFGGSSYRDRA